MSTKPLKLNVLLAKTDTLAPSYKKGLVEYLKFFKDKQGAFKGERKTYEPKADTIDLPSERGMTLVTTTVDEKLKYLVESSKDYIDAKFSQEATNASGIAKSDVVVDGKVLFSQLSVLELMALKTLVKDSAIEEMYKNIPVRSDSEEWVKTTLENYSDREIFESPKQIGTKKSVTKEQYILKDPNANSLKEGVNYQPVVSTKDTIIELGDYTFQKFSGEYSHTKRAEILGRLSKLFSAVEVAIKQANDVEATPSVVTADKIFEYLHLGTI